jgi:hypothetical protein
MSNLRPFVYSSLFAVAGCVSNGSGRGGGPGTAALVSIAVQPADTTVAVDNGVANPIGYTAVGTFADGHTEPLGDATFSLDTAGATLGTLSGPSFAASGAAAGTGHVTAASGDKTGSTSVTVTVHKLNLGMMVPNDGATHFQGMLPTGPLSPQLDYPLDGAVMPTSVKPPDVQWESTNMAGDLYRVKLVAGGATVENIVSGDAVPSMDLTPTSVDWALLVSSAGLAAQPIAVSVDHYSTAGGAQAGPTATLKMISAEVRGAIYYWDLGEGKMQRIDDTGRAPAIPNPPANPTDATNHCVACHVVSHDGKYLSGELWGGGSSGAVFDLSKASANPAPTLAPVNTYNSLFSTFSPDATRLIINDGTALKLIDPTTGMPVTVMGTPLPTAKAAHPTWSPDGSTVAFIDNTDGGWAVDYANGDLAVIPVTGADTFAAPQVIVQGTSLGAGFKVPSWPTFTPDSQFIAFAAGSNSRGRLMGTTYPGALFLVSRAGGTPVQLANACSSGLNCYLPNFSPYDQGGYFWLVFYSLRDYGNAQAGTKGATRRQLWVTAVDKSKLGSGDASSVPYWLPDQDAKTDNMSAFWAVAPPLQ